jgi:hypothetical protein
LLVAEEGAPSLISASSEASAGIPLSLSIAAESPIPAPAFLAEREMSPYGWVGTWNWTVGAEINSDSVVYKEKVYPRERPEFEGHAFSARGLELGVEKVLSPSYASAIALAWGNASIGDDVGLPRYRLDSFALTWEQKANSSGAWVPPTGWTWGWGPQGKALRPSLDVKITSLFDVTNETGVGSATDAKAHVSVSVALPLFNGCSFLIAYSNLPPLRKVELPPDSKLFGDLVWTRAAFDSKNYLEALSMGLELAWPQFGYPNPLTNANPDGRLLYPRFTFLFSEFSDDIYDTSHAYGLTLQGALKLPLSPRCSLSMGTEKFYSWNAGSFQHYTLAWQFYADNPEHPIPEAAKARKMVPAGPYHRPTERR